MTAATGRLDVPGYTGDWTFGIQWRAVFAAAIVGFAVTLIMATLGAAIGLTAGDAADGGNAKAFGIGAGIWWLITVAVAGIASGRVLAATAHRDPEYRPAIYGTLAWATGVIILLFLLANGIGNMVGGLGAGMGAAASSHQMGNVSPADSARAVQTATDVGKGAAWGLLISQIVGLVATIASAGRRPRAVTRTEEHTTRSRSSTL
jgi:hypothetical protein